MKNLLLVHGAWHDEVCWKDVKEQLSQQGYDVSTITLGGNDGCSRVVTYEEIVKPLEDLLKGSNKKYTLLGHSSAGHVIQYVAPKVADKIEKIVFNNAWILPDGLCQFDLVPPEIREGMTQAAMAREDQRIPIASDFVRGLLAQEATVEKQDQLIDILVDQPLALMTYKANMTEFESLAIPNVLLHCTNDISAPPGTYKKMYEAIKGEHKIVEIDGDHESLFTNPDLFTTALVKCLEL
jgi:pimeloyl-ACP methyl ester carboxylesterase